MSSNKYLDKVAFLSKAIGFADDVIGNTSRRLANEADILARAHAKGLTAKDALAQASEAKARTISARVKTGIGVAGVGTAGFLGLHKYRQHKDNAIMAKLDSMYNTQQ